MTKKLIALTVIALLISSFSYAVATDTDVQQSSKKLAAISASRGIIEEMRSRDIPGLAEKTKHEILSDTRKHFSMLNSEREIKTFLSTKFDSIIEKNLKDIHKNFGIMLTEQEFLDFVKNKYKNKLTDNRDNFLNTKGKEAFEAGRKKAVSEQLEEISWELYPDQEIVEDLYKMDWKTNLVNEKKKLLNEKKKKKVVGEELLEEVLKDLDQNIDKIFKHAKEQIVAQFYELNHEPDRNFITQKLLNDFWAKKVADRIAIMTKNKQPCQMVYKDLFISVSSCIETKANTEEQKRFRSFIINGTSFQVTDSNFIICTIEKEIERHKNYQDSRALITDHFIEDAKKKFVNDYVNMAPEEERAGFKKRLTDQHMSAVEGDIRARVLKLIVPDLKKARRMIAHRQLKRHFPCLADRSLELLSKNEVIIKRIMVDQNLSVSTFGECMKSPVREAIKNGEVDTRKLLDETESVVVDGMAFIVDEAKRAWNGQENIYLAHQSYIWDVAEGKKINIYNEMKSRMSNNGPLGESDKEKFLKHFTQEIASIWKKNRIMIIWPQERPSYADTKYIELFEYLKKEIEKALNNNIVKAIDKLEAERKEKAKLVAERKEKAKLVAEKKEKAKLVAEKKEKAKLVAEKKEKAKLVAEKKEKASLKAGGDGTGITEKESSVIEKYITKYKTITKNAWWVWPVIILLALLLLLSIIYIVLRSRWTFKPVLLEKYIKDEDYFVYEWNNLEIVVEQESGKIPAPKQIHVRKAK
jgi:hypothetical protein